MKITVYFIQMLFEHLYHNQMQKMFYILINTLLSDGILEELKEYQYDTQFAQNFSLQTWCEEV